MLCIILFLHLSLFFKTNKDNPHGSSTENVIYGTAKEIKQTKNNSHSSVSEKTFTAHLCKHITNGRTHKQHFV